MLEMKQTGPEEVTLWLDGRMCGGAAWSWGELAWGRESVKVICLSRFDAAQENREALLAYLEYLWEGKAVAAVQWPDGTLRWYHKALEQSWRAAGAPAIKTP